MKAKQMLAVGTATILVAVSRISGAQGQTLSHNANLRGGPSTSTRVLERLAKGDDVTLVSRTPVRGFYHVTTRDGKVGWVYSRFVVVARASNESAVAAHSEESSSGPLAADSSTQCNPELWEHVYHPSRLIVKEQCVAVEGVIVDATANERIHRSDGVRHEPDGDSHGWLRLDPQYRDLINAGNEEYEEGNIVFEIICRYPITQADAKEPCRGDSVSVTLPPVGSHVRIVGTYVLDTNHGRWNEIHPVTSITVVP